MGLLQNPIFIVPMSCLALLVVFLIVSHLYLPEDWEENWDWGWCSKLTKHIWTNYIKGDVLGIDERSK